VIAQANDTIFGLACYFYARTCSRVIRVPGGAGIRDGGVNTGLISTEGAPFGGSSSRASGARGRGTGSRTTWR
jgi:succinate-semialdehyde dehydrogenase/glutarate-semialdehyde dehydrogenase